MFRLQLWVLACVRRLELHQDMVRIVDEKSAHLALCIAEIRQISGNLYVLGDQFVCHGLEIVDHKGEMANANLVQFDRRPADGILGRTFRDR
jgi:hypothetical protein